MNKNKILYSCGVIASILIIIAVLVFSSVEKNKSKPIGETVQLVSENDNNTTELASTSEDKTVNESKSEEFSEIENKKSEEQQSSKSTTKSNIKTETKEVKKVENQTPVLTFIMPVEGEIIRDYAKDKLVYSDTLKEWVTHLGIDIKSAKTSIVKASAPGKISAIKNDPRFGLSVVIDHSEGYTTVYSNLLTAEFVTVGEDVEQGETIGTVGNTAAFEILDEPHLHFEILKDAVQIDPNMYL